MPLTKNNCIYKIILKQYKECLSIERKHGSSRKKGFVNQSKAKKIKRIFLEEKWLKNLDFVKTHQNVLILYTKEFKYYLL